MHRSDAMTRYTSMSLKHGALLMVNSGILGLSPHLLQKGVHGDTSRPHACAKGDGVLLLCEAAQRRVAQGEVVQLAIEPWQAEHEQLRSSAH